MKFTKPFVATLMVLSMVITACTDYDGADTPQVETDTPSLSRSDYPQTEQMDVIAPDTPILAHAEFASVAFPEASSQLTPEAKDSLDSLMERLDGEAPVLLTLRMQNGDTVHATEPTEAFKKLSPERVTAVKNYLIQSGVAIEQVEIDESGVVPDSGADGALARGTDETPEDAQIVVITISTEGARGLSRSKH